ncbi:methylesterase [Actinidia rufa]|uniref:Methylesterase n=1 Tax=Actinidia rufa TaxID=165716 RepID=A0A7J0EJ84_9ERIC|nr:methylesterase [Actinidia rufa]
MPWSMVLVQAGHPAQGGRPPCHRLGLGGCGADPRRLDETTSISDYLQPLVDFMASLPDGEGVVLVGHSFGGLAISLAMERFPKILVAVFITTYMPNFKTPRQLSYKKNIIPSPHPHNSATGEAHQVEPSRLVATIREA